MLQHPAGKFAVHADLEKYVCAKGKSARQADDYRRRCSTTAA